MVLFSAFKILLDVIAITLTNRSKIPHTVIIFIGNNIGDKAIQLCGKPSFEFKYQLWHIVDFIANHIVHDFHSSVDNLFITCVL